MSETESKAWPEPVGYFLPLLSQWVHEAVVDAVSAAGFRALSRTDFAAAVPAFVLIDRGTRKEDYLKAGFFRGYGVPVIFIGPADAQGRRYLARTLGCYTVRDPETFLAWFATRPPYLDMAPVRPPADLDRDRAAALAELERTG